MSDSIAALFQRLTQGITCYDGRTSLAQVRSDEPTVVVVQIRASD